MSGPWHSFFLVAPASLPSASLLADTRRECASLWALLLAEAHSSVIAALRCHGNVMQTEWGGREEGGPA